MQYLHKRKQSAFEHSQPSWNTVGSSSTLYSDEFDFDDESTYFNSSAFSTEASSYGSLPLHSAKIDGNSDLCGYTLPNSASADGRHMYTPSPTSSKTSYSHFEWVYNGDSILSRDFAEDDSRSPVYQPNTSEEPEPEALDSDWDSESEAQYIIIHPGSPWYKNPCSPAQSLCDSAANYADYDSSQPTFACEQDVPRATLGMPLDSFYKDMVLEAFCEDMKRLIPEDVYFDFDNGWLDMMDPELLAHPLDAFREISFGCDYQQSVVPLPLPGEVKPLPDVPVDLFEDEEAPLYD